VVCDTGSALQRAERFIRSSKKDWAAAVGSTPFSVMRSIMQASVWKFGRAPLASQYQPLM